MANPLFCAESTNYGSLNRITVKVGYINTCRIDKECKLLSKVSYNSVNINVLQELRFDGP